MKHELNFVNNQFVTSTSGQHFDVFSPATEALVGTVPRATANEVTHAIDCAQLAQKTWRKLSSIERGQHLQNLANKLVEFSGAIGQALALESGKSLEDSTNEAIYAAEVTRYHAEWARRIEGEVIPSDSPNENLILMREPIGVVAALIPFNYPVYTLLRKIAPALITGNAVVVRPSNNTPLSAFEIARAVQAANFPAGVINIMTMDHDIAQVLCTDSRVGMITLTGSVRAGQHVLEYSKTNIAKVSLELGGKTPVIVAQDADLEKAAKAIVMSKTTNCGQLCTAAERVYVHESVYAEFMGYLKEAFANVKFGNRADHPTYMGPLISEHARQNAHAMVQRAVAAGAVIEAGGYIPEGKGHFYPATLLSHVSHDMEIVQEETFAPILPVMTYKTDDEALAMANDHQFGLASVLFTNNYQRTMMFANNIEAGELYINRTPADPYQGYHAGWKRSGLGGDDGKHGMLEFTQTRLVIMKY